MTLQQDTAARRSDSPMPGTPGLPLLGHTVAFATGRLTASTDFYDRFGAVYWNRALGRTWVNVETPETCGAVLQDRARSFDASGWSLLIGPFFRRGLMLLDGQEHHAHRRIMQGAFTAQRLAGYLPAINDTVATALDRWEPGERHFYPSLKQLTLDVAADTFMAADPGADADRLNTAFVDAVRAGTALVRRPVPGLRWSRGLAGRRVLEDYLRPRVAERRQATDDSPDLFTALCRARDEDGTGFDDEDVVNHMIFLLMAAHDTATITTTAMAYHLATHPEWQDRCADESLALGDRIGYDELDRLEGLDLVMKESLRLVTPVPGLVRRANQETEIGGHRIAAGTYVAVHLWGLHHREEIWPDPFRFDPDRFSEPRREDKAHRHAFLPFGGGIHKCIGLYFGGMEVKAAMHQLLRRYRISVADGYEMPVDWSSLPRPRDGLPVHLEPR